MNESPGEKGVAAIVVQRRITAEIISNQPHQLIALYREELEYVEIGVRLGYVPETDGQTTVIRGAVTLAVAALIGSDERRKMQSDKARKRGKANIEFAQDFWGSATEEERAAINQRAAEARGHAWSERELEILKKHMSSLDKPSAASEVIKKIETLLNNNGFERTPKSIKRILERLNYSKKRVKWSDAEKERCMQLADSGISYPEIVKELNKYFHKGESVRNRASVGAFISRKRKSS